MRLSLVSHKTLVAIKPSIAKDAVNYLGKATIELRKRTLKWQVKPRTSRCDRRAPGSHDGPGKMPPGA